ncbi:MAG: CPBP family intramembrane glutamic endopeptidase [Cyanobacteria bacterium J06623_7]
MNSKTIADNNPFARVKTRSIVYWFVLAIPLLLILYIVVGTSLDLPGIIARQRIDFEDPLFSSILINSFFYLIIIAWLLFYQNRTKLSFSYLWGRRALLTEYGGLLLLVIPLMLFAFGSTQIIYYLLYLVSPEVVDGLLSQELLLTAKSTAYPGLYNTIQVIAIVILAPIVEEILFRGVFFHRWGTKWSVRTAVITSSIIFGCLHFNLLWASLFGLVMCFAYLKTKSLAVPIAMHFLNNFIALGISFWFLWRPNPESTSIDALQSSLGQSAIATLVASIWLIIFCRRHWRLIQKPLPYFANRDAALD